MRRPQLDLNPSAASRCVMKAPRAAAPPPTPPRPRWEDVGTCSSIPDGCTTPESSFRPHLFSCHPAHPVLPLATAVVGEVERIVQPRNSIAFTSIDGCHPPQTLPSLQERGQNAEKGNPSIPKRQRGTQSHVDACAHARRSRKKHPCAPSTNPNVGRQRRVSGGHDSEAR